MITESVVIILLLSCVSLWSHGLYSPPGFTVQGLFQTRIWEWIAIPFIKGSSCPRDWIQGFCHIPYITDSFFITEPIRKPIQKVYIILLFISVFSVFGMLKVLAAYILFLEFQVALAVKNPLVWTEDLKRHGFNPWIRKIPWRREWQPTSVFLPGESHGQRSLSGYGP